MGGGGRMSDGQAMGGVCNDGGRCEMWVSGGQVMRGG